MTKLRFDQEVTVKNGRIVRSRPLVETTIPEQQRVLDVLRPILNTWLKARIAQNIALLNTSIVVRGQYSESNKGFAIEFKVQSVVSVG